MKTRSRQVLAVAALLGLICACGALTGCGESKPPQTSAPGSEHVAAEQQDEKDTSVVHTNNGAAGNQGANTGQSSGNQ